jgi:hypothetical protein
MAWRSTIPRLDLLSDQQLMHASVAWPEDAETPIDGDRIHLEVLQDLTYHDTGTVVEGMQRRNRRHKYPWHLWTDGAVWIAEREWDFTVTQDSFRTSLCIRSYAQDQQCVSRKLSDDVLAFQYVPKETVTA